MKTIQTWIEFYEHFAKYGTKRLILDTKGGDSGLMDMLHIQHGTVKIGETPFFFTINHSWRMFSPRNGQRTSLAPNGGLRINGRLVFDTLKFRIPLVIDANVKIPVEDFAHWSFSPGYMCNYHPVVNPKPAYTLKDLQIFTRILKVPIKKKVTEGSMEEFVNLVQLLSVCIIKLMVHPDRDKLLTTLRKRIAQH